MSVNGVNDIVPLSMPINPTPIQLNNPQEITCARKPLASETTVSQERKTKQKKYEGHKCNK